MITTVRDTTQGLDTDPATALTISNEGFDGSAWVTISIGDTQAEVHISDLAAAVAGFVSLYDAELDRDRKMR